MRASATPARPFKRPESNGWKAMWGIIPAESRAPAKVSSSPQPRTGAMRAHPSAARAESQFHWCGYVRGDGTV
jgi:hypothetical protein